MDPNDVQCINAIFAMGLVGVGSTDMSKSRHIVDFCVSLNLHSFIFTVYPTTS